MARPEGLLPKRPLSVWTPSASMLSVHSPRMFFSLTRISAPILYTSQNTSYGYLFFFFSYLYNLLHTILGYLSSSVSANFFFSCFFSFLSTGFVAPFPLPPSPLSLPHLDLECYSCITLPVLLFHRAFDRYISLGSFLSHTCIPPLSRPPQSPVGLSRKNSFGFPFGLLGLTFFPPISTSLTFLNRIIPVLTFHLFFFQLPFPFFDYRRRRGLLLVPLSFPKPERTAENCFFSAC